MSEIIASPVISVGLPVVAIFVSICSFLFTIWYNLRQARVNPMISYLAQLVSVEARIAQTPTVLRFHGVEVSDLENHGVSAEEFAYLVTSFTLGGAWYRAFAAEGDVSPYKPGEYRHDMCASTATQKAWPLLKRMMEETSYRSKIEATIEATKKS